MTTLSVNKAIFKVLKSLSCFIFLFFSHFLFGQSQNEVEKLGDLVNSAQYDEISPVVSLDGKYLFFTRTGYPDFNRIIMEDQVDISQTLDEASYLQTLGNIYSMISGRAITDPVNSRYNQDVWIADLSHEEGIQIQHPGPPLNNALPNSIVATAKDTGSYILINQFYKDGSMYAGFSSVSHLSGGFSFPKPIHIYDFLVQSEDVSMTMSYDADVIIISMNQFDSFGSKDLYVCFRVKNDLYSTPQHIGSVLNSKHQESNPFISRDKRSLYFSSDRPGGLGGHDIYVSKRMDYTWKKWTEPTLLEEPINSPFDDSQPYFDEVNNHFYFSSMRDGSSDIFRLSMTPVPKLEQPIIINGQIINSETGKPIRSELFYGPVSASGYLEFFNTYNGQFKAVLTENEVYKFQPRKPNFESKRIHFDVRLAASTGKFEHDLILYVTPLGYPDASGKPQKDNQPVFESNESETIEKPAILLAESKYVKDKNVSFYDIFFTQSKPTILKESLPALDALTEILIENPALVILIEGHTDNVGDDEKNIILSKERADAIKGYLVEKGISDDRVKTEGFGPFRPITDNSTETNRQRNRRVEIKILN